MKTGRVRGVLACALCVALGWPAAHADEPQVARTYQLQALLDVDATGQVTHVGLPDEIPSVLAGPAREAIGRWRFKPPVREGRAVPTRTYAKVALQLVPQAGGNYGLHTVYRSNGPKLSFTRLPEYPLSELRQRGQGKLVMEAIVQPDGTLTDIHMASYRFNHSNPGAFEKSAETVMQHAHAQSEWVDGKAVATRVQVPFVYTLQRISRSEALSRLVRKDAGEPDDAGASPIGEVVALDSPVQRVPDPPG